MAEQFESFLVGNGVELSRQRTLKNVSHVYIKPNNLYSLREHFKPESLEFLFFNGINETKFYRILIKEMMVYCKIGGHIIVQIEDNKILNFDELINELKLCIGDNGEIVKIDNKNKRVIVKKINNLIDNEDSIDKWSFGIVTNGKKNDWVEKQIKAIKAQKIPNYEIIVCGTYFDRNEDNFRYIPFNEKDDRGWITKKKNILCQAARYENLMILHDRIVLDKNWYKGMKKYGNYFEVLSCKVYNDKGERCGDWITYGNRFGLFPKVGLLEYYDWDKYGYLDGALYILKKAVWKKTGWDESLFWNDGEDIKLSKDWYDFGIVIRFNPNSECTTLSWRHGILPHYSFNRYKLGKYPIYFHKKIIPLLKFYIKKILWKK